MTCQEICPDHNVQCQMVGDHASDRKNLRIHFHVKSEQFTCRWFSKGNKSSMKLSEFTKSEFAKPPAFWVRC